MPKTEAPARLRLFALASVCIAVLSIFARPAAATTLGRSYFFVNRDACAASGVFGRRACAAAFDNARAQLRDRAPRFSSGAECRLHFRLCDLTQPEAPVEKIMSYAPSEEVSYTPIALGVELVVSAKGIEAAPTLAVEAAVRLFPFYPVSRPYQPDRQEGEEALAESQSAAILPSDHFEPFYRRMPPVGPTSFTEFALGAIETATREPVRPETIEERRRRLRSAPLVQ
jgi:hypothetical protein